MFYHHNIIYFWFSSSESAGVEGSSPDGGDGDEDEVEGGIEGGDEGDEDGDDEGGSGPPGAGGMGGG